MSDEKNINHFTAADIEKYHKGLLTPREMHELEKAALEDPFLADAMEGFAVAGVNLDADMADLNQQLSKKYSEAKVIPMVAAPRNSFRILRAAVVVAFIATAGLLIYKFGFDKKEDRIAKSEIKQSAPANDNTPAVTRTSDSATAPGNTDAPVSNTPAAETEGGKTRTTTPVTITNTGEANTTPAPIERSESRGVIAEDDATPKTVTENKPVVASVPPPAPPRSVTTTAPEKPALSKDEAREETADNKKLKSSGTDKETTNSRDAYDQPAKRAAPTVGVSPQPGGNNRDGNLFMNQSMNQFRGRVTDADNNGVPFANISPNQDKNAGTYTDANGYFSLNAQDSVLQVQVRSVGFEENKVLLRNSVPNNQVTLQSDRARMQEVVVTGYGSQKKDAGGAATENHPSDGWDKYNAYLANNLQHPASAQNRQGENKDVTVSFEVNKNGSPVQFRVERSGGNTFDKEAIRVIKEGPKWKRGSKKTRTSVTVHF